MSASALIGIDWGTPSARAYRIGPDGGVLEARSATARDPEARRRRLCRRAGGTAGSLARRPGAAACLRDDRQPPGLARGAVRRLPGDRRRAGRGHRRTAGGELAIVPGVISRDSAGMPDVMRGEETQVVGAIDGDAASGAACFPERTASGRSSSTAPGRLRDLYDRRAVWRARPQHSRTAGGARERRGGPGRLRARRRAGRRPAD